MAQLTESARDEAQRVAHTSRPQWGRGKIMTATYHDYLRARDPGGDERRTPC